MKPFEIDQLNAIHITENTLFSEAEVPDSEISNIYNMLQFDQHFSEMVGESLIFSDYLYQVPGIGESVTIPFGNLINIEREAKRLQKAIAKSLNAKGLELKDTTVSKIKKKAGHKYLTTQYQISDGQTITMFFHDPIGGSGKIDYKTKLVAYETRLNKQPVTAAIIKGRGKTMPISQIGSILAGLASQNHEKWVSQSEKRAENKAALEAAKSSLDTSLASVKSLNDEHDKLDSQEKDLDSKISDLNASIKWKKNRLAEIQAEIDNFQKDKGPEQMTTGEVGADGKGKSPTDSNTDADTGQTLTKEQLKAALTEDLKKLKETVDFKSTLSVGKRRDGSAGKVTVKIKSGTAPSEEFSNLSEQIYEIIKKYRPQLSNVDVVADPSIKKSMDELTYPELFVNLKLSDQEKGSLEAVFNALKGIDNLSLEELTDLEFEIYRGMESLLAREDIPSKIKDDIRNMHREVSILKNKDNDTSPPEGTVDGDEPDKSESSVSDLVSSKEKAIPFVADLAADMYPDLTEDDKSMLRGKFQEYLDMANEKLGTFMPGDVTKFFKQQKNAMEVGLEYLGAEPGATDESPAINPKAEKFWEQIKKQKTKIEIASEDYGGLDIINYRNRDEHEERFKEFVTDQIENKGVKITHWEWALKSYIQSIKNPEKPALTKEDVIDDVGNNLPHVEGWEAELDEENIGITNGNHYAAEVQYRYSAGELNVGILIEKEADKTTFTANVVKYFLDGKTSQVDEVSINDYKDIPGILAAAAERYYPDESEPETDGTMSENENSAQEILDGKYDDSPSVIEDLLEQMIDELEESNPEILEKVSDYYSELLAKLAA